ncbi:MAG: oligosaccharide flippase family protein, partial [Bacteroidetes bacterium]|nr:oligosaccharide flippase family protein [Bacteroidota bacterium]
MKDLLKTTSAIGLTEALLVFVALARNKYLALTIGPEGFGIYGLLSAFFMMIAFASTWMATGTIKYTSEYQAKGDKESLNSIFSFSTIIATVIGVFLTIILIVWRKWFIITFLSNDINEIYYLIFCAAFIAICLRPIFLGILQGLKRIKEVVITRWSIAIFNLLITIILVWFWDLTGFFISLLVNAIFAIIILCWGIKRNGGLQLNKFTWQDPIIRLLWMCGCVNFFLAIINLS